jgi:alkylhydroperoxidase/carboxymuconolactone decarboxylase family protein YurZ
MKKSLPQSVIKFESKYPEIWKAFAALGEACHEIGPLDEKTRRLVKLGIAIATRHEGAVHSATRNALNAGISPEDVSGRNSVHYHDWLASGVCLDDLD